MVDTWQPNKGSDTVSATDLQRVANLISSQSGAKEDIKQLSDSDIELFASYMNATEAAWIGAIRGLSDEQVLNLCMLFTLGEMEFPTWSFAGKNPCIYFLRHLKAKKTIVEKDFIRWLKKQTDNRYIPYGPVL
jgi:hypothetical protein